MTLREGDEGGEPHAPIALDVRLLGSIGAERHGEAVALGGPRQRAVLARLALVAGQVVTVDRLVDDVWSGAPPTTAVNTLQSYVSLLRRALGDPSLLRRDGPGYVFAVDREQLDAGRFEDRAARGLARLALDPAAALALLDEALGEWRGPALADVGDEDWARAAVVRWDELRLATTESRFDALLLLGRHAEAIGELERAADGHPMREGLTHRLMLALYRSGRQADALAAFARTRERLADELGLDPGPDLDTLRSAILHHDPSLALPTRPVTGRSTDIATVASPVPLPGPAARAGATPFVGRRTQLTTIHRVWDACVAGAPHLVLLNGEAGVGKSRLAAEFAVKVHAAGGIVLWGRATADAVVPFEPMVEAIRTVLRAVSPEARRRVADDRGLLSMLLPELERIVPEAHPVSADPDVERYLLFETVTGLLQSESARHPVLVVLDDLQWADGPTLALLEHVLRDDLASRVLAVATVRTPGEDPMPALDRMALRLERDGVLTRIAVGGLGAEDVGELLDASDRRGVDADELRRATGGNAFYVTELIRHGGQGMRGTDLPDSVRAMIDQRLERLDHMVNQVLNVVAVAGQDATLPVLVAACDSDASQPSADRLLDATDVAMAAGLLVEDGAGRLAMPHALIRQAILARLSRTRRLDLHRRIGEALEHASEPHAVPETLAYHLFEAGSLTDLTRRVSAGLEAGRRALELAAYDDAMGWVERVHQLATRQVPRGLHAEMELLHSDAARARGDRVGAVDAARRAAEHARETGPEPMLLARSAEAWMLSMSAVGFDIGHPPDTDLVALMAEAIASLPADERRYGVRLRSMLSSVLVGTYDWDARESLAEEAITIAESDGRPELIASAHLARRLAWWRLDRLHERTDAVLLAVREAHRAGNLHLELTATLFALADLMELGRLGEHAELLAQFEERGSVLHQPLYDVYARFIEAGNELAAGRYATAARLADQALDDGLASHGVNATIAHAGVQFRIHHDRGTLDATLAESERMAARHPRLRMWQIALATGYDLSGRLDEARPIFEALVDADSVELRDNQMFLPATCTLVEVADALGDRRRAAVLRRELEPYAGRLAVSGLGGIAIGPVSRYVGLAARVSGDLGAGEQHLRSAIAESARLGMVPYEAAARHDLAALLDERGRPGDAAAAAAEAAAATQLAAAIGLVLPPSQGPAGRAPLT